MATSSLEDWVLNYYTIKENKARCDICYKNYWANNIVDLCRHLTSHHKVEEDKAKGICEWLRNFYIKNDMNAKYCRCNSNDCNNDIPNKPVYLMIHLKQVHDRQIPSGIKPTGLWCHVVPNITKWILYYYLANDILTTGKVKCYICGTGFTAAINTRNIRSHINLKHIKNISTTHLQRNEFFFIEDNQMKCNLMQFNNKCDYSLPIISYIKPNEKLEHHLLNNHINHAEINDLFNWLKLYQHVLYFQTAECKICENISKQNFFNLMIMRHFIEEHRIEFLFHLISKKLLDKLEILNSDTGDVALPGSSSQQPGQSINQSSSKITPSLPDISKIKSSDIDTEGVGTSAISSYQQRTPRLHNLEIMLSDYSEIKSSDDDTEDIGTSATSSYQQPTEELNNQEEISLSLYDYSNYDLIINSEYQISFIQEFGEAI